MTEHAEASREDVVKLIGFTPLSLRVLSAVNNHLIYEHGMSQEELLSSPKGDAARYAHIAALLRDEIRIQDLPQGPNLL